MTQSPNVINVGKTYLVYKGEEYKVVAGQVERHATDEKLPARKNKTISRVVAVYSEILNDDLTLLHSRQIMSEGDIKAEIRQAKAKNKPLTERRLKNIAKGKAILTTEFHSLENAEPPINPIFRFRSLKLGKLLIEFSAIALIIQIILLLTAGGRGGGDWPVFSDTSGLIFSLSLIAYIPVIFHAIAWLLDLSHEIKHNQDLNLHIPLPSHFLIALTVILIGDITYLLFDGNGNFGIWLFAVAFRLIGTLVWVLLVGRFFQGVGRLIGLSHAASFRLSLIFILLPILAHIPIVYLQRRLNLLDRSKANLIIN